MTAGILVREGVLLAVLLALGLGPASYLPRSWGTAARAALAPALGLAIGSATLTTVSFVLPLRHSLWFAVLPLCVASAALAARRWQFDACPVMRRELGALALVALWSLAVFSAPMLVRQSYGPMGYGIFDAPGYGASIFGYARNTTDTHIGISPADYSSSRHDRTAWGEPWDLTTRYAWGWVYQHNGATTLPAALSLPLRWPAWTLVTPFMAVLVTVTGLGVFAAGLRVFERRLAAACLAAVLALGPVLLQIHTDGSLGLLAGLALFPAVVICTSWISEGAGLAGAICLGVLFAGLQAVYPELLVIAGLTTVLSFVFQAASGKRHFFGRGGVGPQLLVAGSLGAVLSPRTLPWTADYLVGLVTHNLEALSGLLVRYNMRPQYLLGWLFQTREFYSFAFRNPGGALQIWWGLVVPFSGLALAGVGLARRRELRPFGWLIIAAILQAVAALRADCPYCVQRSLVVIALPLPLLLVGARLAIADRRAWRVPTTIFIGLLMVGTASTLVGVERRVIDAAYLPSEDLQLMVRQAAALPNDGAPLLLEGFDSIPVWSWAEVPTTYMALRETGRRVSIAAADNEYGGFSYLRTRPVGHPTFTPDYEWVLTRFRALDSGRETVTGIGPFALQRRTRPFDVSLVAGVATDVDDHQGTPWIVSPGKRFGLEQGPLTAWVTGPAVGTAWVEIRLQAPPGATIVGPPGVRGAARPDGVLVSCVPVPPSAPVRAVAFTVTSAPADFLPPSKNDSPVYRPAHSSRLLTLRAYDHPCPE